MVAHLQELCFHPGGAALTVAETRREPLQHVAVALHSSSGDEAPCELLPSALPASATLTEKEPIPTALTAVDLLKPMVVAEEKGEVSSAGKGEVSSTDSCVALCAAGAEEGGSFKLRHVSAVPVDTTGDGQVNAWAIASAQDGKLDTIITGPRVAEVRSRRDPIEIPAALMCPITVALLVDPVITADGLTYERSAIQNWLERNSTSPLTGEVLPHKQLLPNHMARSMARVFAEENAAQSEECALYMLARKAEAHSMRHEQGGVVTSSAVVAPHATVRNESRKRITR